MPCMARYLQVYTNEAYVFLISLLQKWPGMGEKERRRSCRWNTNNYYTAISFITTNNGWLVVF